MKNKIWSILFVLIIAVLLSACNEESSDDEMELKMLEVDLEVAEQVEVGETVDLLATVTYGEELVADADEVEYEVWEKNAKDDSYRVEATNNDDGTYTAETSFDKDGIYHVQVHVTARDLHTMPQQEVTVGEGGEYADPEESEESNSEH